MLCQWWTRFVDGGPAVIQPVCLMFAEVNDPLKPEFTIVIFIHYKPRIAVAILDL